MSRTLAASISRLFDLASAPGLNVAAEWDHASGTEIISIGSISGHCAVLEAFVVC
jgi:hypothetical protein